MNRHHDWTLWGRRLKTHLKEKGENLASLAEKMTLSEATLRSWTNGTRRINLVDFMNACRLAKADPAQILFGKPVLSDDLKKQLGELAVTVLEADPASNPDYETMIAKMKKSAKKRQIPS